MRKKNENRQSTSEKKKKAVYTCKVVIVGCCGVGKTNLITRICLDKFSRNTQGTVGIDLLKKYLKTEDNEMVEICFWDSAGQERYRNVTKQYYKNADAIIYVYSIDSHSHNSFQNLKFWIEEARETTALTNPIEIILCNKIDVREDCQQVGKEEGIKLRDMINRGLNQRDQKSIGKQVRHYDYFEVSAMTGENIDQFENVLFAKLMEKKKHQSPIICRPMYLSDTETLCNSSFIKPDRSKCC